LQFAEKIDHCRRERERENGVVVPIFRVAQCR
jgi:hypothetical protein